MAKKEKQKMAEKLLLLLEENEKIGKKSRIFQK
jgi:hypothetical protein